VVWRFFLKNQKLRRAVRNAAVQPLNGTDYGTKASSVRAAEASCGISSGVEFSDRVK
jgi:hypothetical protein